MKFLIIAVIIGTNGTVEKPIVVKKPQIQMSDLSKAPKEYWIAKIAKMSKSCNLSPALVEAIIRTESTYCQNTKNKTSTARGCMQLLKGTAGADYSSLSDHSESIRLGVAYLCKLKKGFPNTYAVRFHAGNGKLKDLKSLIIPYMNSLNPKKNKFFTRCNEYDKLVSNITTFYKETP